MEDSILISTKKILGVAEEYTAFDLDIITHINAAFSTLDQLGVGPLGGFYITGPDETWDQVAVPPNQLNMMKTYVSLKVRLLFDPPTTGYLIDAMNRQITEYEWRLNVFREVELYGEPIVEPVATILEDG